MLCWSSQPARWRCAWQLWFDAVSRLLWTGDYNVFKSSQNVIAINSWTVCLEVYACVENTWAGKAPWYTGLGPAVIKRYQHLMSDGYSGEIQQTEKSSLSAVRTTSQCSLLAEKHFVSSLCQSITPLFWLSLQLTHSPFHTSTNYQEREQKLSSLPTVNISFCEHMVYTVKLLSCKCYKLSSQNVHVTQFNVVCFHVSCQPMSVCVCVTLLWSGCWCVCTVQY